MIEYAKSSGVISGILVTVVGTVLAAVVMNYLNINVQEQKPVKETPIDYTAQNRPITNEGKGQYRDKVVSVPKQSIEDDFGAYINAPSERVNVSVAIIDERTNLSNDVSSAIASLYRNAGNSTSIGLFRGDFTKKASFQELMEGNSEIIEKLGLYQHTDYLAVGKIRYKYRNSDLVSGSIVCSITISMNVISTSKKAAVKSFTISNANGNGVTEDQAKEDALQMALKYYSENISL